MGTPDRRHRPIGDLTVLDIEAQRQIIQERLDAAKTAVERNRLGQFATPPDLSLDIARYTLDLWERRSDAVAFLDPAIGSGWHGGHAPSITVSPSRGQPFGVWRAFAVNVSGTLGILVST